MSTHIHRTFWEYPLNNPKAVELPKLLAVNLGPAASDGTSLS
jgi:hypothetical protein